MRMMTMMGMKMRTTTMMKINKTMNHLNRHIMEVQHG